MYQIILNRILLPWTSRARFRGMLWESRRCRMRWRLLGDWPVAGWMIPGGTELLAGVSDDGVVSSPMWNGITLPTPLPINAMPLDEDAARQMLAWYPDQRHRLVFGPGLNLEMILRRHPELA
jgi:hypothetical protein